MTEQERVRHINQLVVLTSLVIDKLEDLENDRFPKFALKKAANNYKREIEKYINTVYDEGKRQDESNARKELDTLHESVGKLETFLNEIYGPI